MKKIFIILIFLNFAFLLNSQNIKFIPHVDVYEVPLPKNIPLEFNYPARVKPIKKVKIFARVSGILEKKYFKEGDFVKKGQLLYKIEPDIYIAKYNLGIANLKVAKANFRKALREWKRIKSLYEDKATSKQNYDRALSDFEIAKAEVKKAKAEVNLAKINLNYTKVTSPVSGFTQLKITDVGSLVSYGTPLVSIIQIQPVYVEFSIPDVDYFKIFNLKPEKINTKIILNGKELKEIGFINFINKEIDEKTSTVKFRAVFQNKDKLLIPGAFVRIKLTGIYLKNVITIPVKAVIQKGNFTIVFVVDKNNKAQIRPVITGDTIKEKVVILKGLFPGEKVILNNFFRISPNSLVKVDKIIK